MVGLSISPNVLAEGLALTGITADAGHLISVFIFHRWQFSVPRCNAHRAERLMEKEMKLTTRSQLRRVIGKVCSNGSL